MRGDRRRSRLQGKGWTRCLLSFAVARLREWENATHAGGARQTFCHRAKPRFDEEAVEVTVVVGS